MKKVIFLIGIFGCRKSAIGELLSQDLNIPFFDGGDYHPKDNVDKMSSRKPLNDDDERSWLITLNQLSKSQLEN